MAHQRVRQFLISALLLSIPAVGQQPPAAGAQVLDVQGGKIRVLPLVTGLSHPWGMAFLPDGHTLLIAEQTGQLRLVRDGVLDTKPVWTSPTAAGTVAPGGAGGALHFVALHPQFAQNKLVYLSYPKRDEKRGFSLAVARGRLEGTTLTGVQDIFVADAWETAGNLAGRLFFGPDNLLYVTIGDRDRLCCIGRDDNSIRIKAQSLDTHLGKTLRLRDDGSVPADNPFAGRAGAKPEIYTYGHRNGYGLAIHPETGALWQTEIGPLGGDEVNILVPGHNYGWPLVSAGRNYTGTEVSDQPWARPGMDNPRLYWVPSISPSSMMFYTGDKFPRWKNNLFIGSLNQQQLVRISFTQPNPTDQREQRESLLLPLHERIRDVVQGPDGLIYVATERTSGGTAVDGRLLRIEPVQE
jgi:aldose sugar dehydrogenase